MNPKKDSMIFLCFSLVSAMASIILFYGSNFFGGSLTLGFTLNFIGFAMDPEALSFAKVRDNTNLAEDSKKKNAFYIRLIGSIVIIGGAGTALILS